MNHGPGNLTRRRLMPTAESVVVAVCGRGCCVGQPLSFLGALGFQPPGFARLRSSVLLLNVRTRRFRLRLTKEDIPCDWPAHPALA
jgi:hypothetical protein